MCLSGESIDFECAYSLESFLLVPCYLANPALKFILIKSVVCEQGHCTFFSYVIAYMPPLFWYCDKLCPQRVKTLDFLII